MRACELGIPRVWLPDIEPEASNTIMASSVQGDGFFSALLLEPLPTVIVSNAMIEKEKIQQMALLLQARLGAICVNLPLKCRNLPQEHARRLTFLSQRASYGAKPELAFALGSSIIRGCVALEELDDRGCHVDAGRLLQPLDAG